MIPIRSMLVMHMGMDQFFCPSSRSLWAKCCSATTNYGGSVEHWSHWSKVRNYRDRIYHKPCLTDHRRPQRCLWFWLLLCRHVCCMNFWLFFFFFWGKSLVRVRTSSRCVYSFPHKGFIEARFVSLQQNGLIVSNLFASHTFSKSVWSTKQHYLNISCFVDKAAHRFTFGVSWSSGE